MESRRTWPLMAGVLGLLLLVSGGRAAAINKRPATGIEPISCASKSGDVGICMFAWHCLLFKGTHLSTCYDGFFVGSCCLLPPASSTSNEVLPGPEPVTARPHSSTPVSASLDWRPVTSTSVVTSMFTSNPAESATYALETSGYEEPISTNEWYTTEVITPESEETYTETETGEVEVTSVEEEKVVGESNEYKGNTTDSVLRTTLSPTTLRPTTQVPTTMSRTETTTQVPTTTVVVTVVPANTTSMLRPSSSTSKPSSSTSKPSSSTSKPSSSTSKPNSAVPEVATTPLPNRTTEALQNYREVCGKPELGPRGRIVGGLNSHYAEWPWMISLRQWKKSTFLHKCGAALLNGLWAITAAHCVESVPPGDILLRLGEYDVSSDKEPEVFEERRVQIVASHPKFDPRTFEYDLALLRFYQPVRFRRNILPICIPKGEELFVGKTATVTGWGRLYEDGPLPSVMQEVQVPVITNAECETMYKKAGFVEDIPDIFICAGKFEGGKDSCEGDSGGPMVLKDAEGRWALAGIISWGIGCALPNQPGVYTRITKFASWIEQIIAF